MKKFFLILIAALSSVTAMAVSFPDIYVRGDCNGWQALPEYKMAREGNVYSIHLDQLDGTFKIATADWEEVDFGGASADARIVHDSELEIVRRGSNIAANGLSNVTLYIVYEPDASETTLYVDRKPEVEPYNPGNQASGTLPILFINVYKDATHAELDNEVISRDLDHKNYFKNAEYWLDMNGCEWLMELGCEDIGSAESPLPLQIKARGNWTRKGFSKKPFKLKLDKKASMLGMSKSKHYAILAHADDDTGYLKNFTGFSLGKRIGLPWTPSMQPLEVIINGDYRGIYFLTESIRVEEDRVNITELADNEADPKLASGGYLVELDNYDEDNQIRMPEKTCVNLPVVDMLRITFDTPEEYSDIQRRFVGEQFSAMNDAVGANSDELWRYLDIDDAARYYIVEEIISHYEAYHGSTYLFRDYGENQKWHFSPLWDCGNAFRAPSNDWFYNHGPYGNTWIPSMRCNSTFNNKVEETWKWFYGTCYDGIEEEIRQFAEHVKAAAAYDKRRWENEPAPAGGQGVADNTDMDSKAEFVIRFLRDKTGWLAGKWGNGSSGYPEPDRDTTPAAPLPEYVTTGVDGIEAAPSSETVRYYNLQGLEVKNPVKGQLYIRIGSKAEKVVFGL